jgi:hypothetical protein
MGRAVIPAKAAHAVNQRVRLVHHVEADGCQVLMTSERSEVPANADDFFKPLEYGLMALDAPSMQLYRAEWAAVSTRIWGENGQDRKCLRSPAHTELR